MDDFWVELATVINAQNHIVFKVDNGQKLIAKPPKKFDADNGQRVLLNFTYLIADTIKINAVSIIHTADVVPISHIGDMPKDPVVIQSIWLGGDHLNIIFEYEFNSITHEIDLFYDINDTAEVNLYFMHNRKGDTPGYMKKAYASFNLSALKNNLHKDTPIRVHVNTKNGEKTFNLTV